MSSTNLKKTSLAVQDLSKILPAVIDRSQRWFCYVQSTIGALGGVGKNVFNRYNAKHKQRE